MTGATPVEAIDTALGRGTLPWAIEHECSRLVEQIRTMSELFARLERAPQLRAFLQRAEHRARHREHEHPARSAMHAAYDRRRRARRRRR